MSTPNTSMQIDYDLTAEDAAAFSVYNFRTSPRFKRRLRISQAMGVFATLIIAVVWPNWTIIDRLIFTVLLFLLFVFGYPLYYRWAIRRNALKTYSAAKSKSVLGEYTVIIESAGLTEKGSVSESKVAWSGVEKIENDNQYIYIFTSPLQAHVIPKRAFRNNEESQTFLETAKRFFSQSPTS
ncbi:MAG TPA: YcxB family protein [Pyrinomonadaceae bacterium]|nr:YcxB family protein [Pyrinomonadaceae bacterium]